MNPWRWLTTPDPRPGLHAGKIARIALRFFLFLLLVTLVQTLLAATPLRPYLMTWWGSALTVLLLYIPFFRFLTLDMPQRSVGGRAGPGSRPGAPSATAKRRAERNKYAGVKKGPPRGGRR